MFVIDLTKGHCGMTDWSLAWNREKDRIAREKYEAGRKSEQSDRHPIPWIDASPWLRAAFIEANEYGFRAGYEARVEEEQRGE